MERGNEVGIRMNVCPPGVCNEWNINTVRVGGKTAGNVSDFAPILQAIGQSTRAVANRYGVIASLELGRHMRRTVAVEDFLAYKDMNHMVLTATLVEMKTD